MDYAAQGIYCSLDKPSPLSSSLSERFTNYTDMQFVHVVKPQSLRYEVMLSSTNKGREIDGKATTYTWMIVRVTKRLTGSGSSWQGIPIYVSKTDTDLQVPTSGWTAVTRKNKKQREYDALEESGSYEYNQGVGGQEIAVTPLEIASSSSTVNERHLSVIQGYDSVVKLFASAGASAPGGDTRRSIACLSRVCNYNASPDPLEIEAARCLHLPAVLASAQLAEIGGDTDLAKRRYFEVIGCLTADDVEGGGLGKRRSRFERWELANAYSDLARSQAAGGLEIQKAIASTSKALEFGPEEFMRRGLFTDLGDLHLAAGRVDDASKAYKFAREAVKTKGGRPSSKGMSVDTMEFSVGGGLTADLGKELYGKVRAHLILEMPVQGNKEWAELRGSWEREAAETIRRALGARDKNPGIAQKKTIDEL
jgi:hypothetical protein